MEHDNVNHPKHYMEGFAPVNIECIDITRHMSFCLGNAFKYVWRAGKKGGKEKAIEDLEKAKWYLIEASRQNERGMCSKYEVEGMRAARAVFGLLSCDYSERYCALSQIVRGNTGLATMNIDRMIDEEEGAV